MVKIKDLGFDTIFALDGFFGDFQAWKLHELDKFHEWFFSKYPDIENPLMKQYPEDTRDGVIGEGIFESIDEYQFHYGHRLAISKLIKDFCVDVMGATSANIDNDFEINGEFIAKYDIVVRAFLNTILRGRLDGDISKG